MGVRAGCSRIVLLPALQFVERKANLLPDVFPGSRLVHTRVVLRIVRKRDFRNRLSLGEWLFLYGFVLRFYGYLQREVSGSSPSGSSFRIQKVTWVNPGTAALNGALEVVQLRESEPGMGA